jgi:uncharacterized membrane protein
MTTDLPGPAPQALAVDAGRGLRWWADAWPLFTRAAGMWIVLTLILIVIFVLVGLVPLLGGLAASLLAPVFAGSLMQAAQKVDAGGSLEVGDLFTGFRDKLTPLLTLGALLLAFSLALGVLAAFSGLGALLGAVAGGANESPATVLAALGTGMIALLVVLVLGLLVAMAYWFAPALVVLRGVAPMAALKASFAGCMRNVLPMLVYGVIYIVASILASIPFGLGWLVLLPVLTLTIYVSYRDVFETQPPGAPSAASVA